MRATGPPEPPRLAAGRGPPRRNERTALNRSAAIFDLDGVLTDTAELHYRSWLRLTRELGIPFDRAANEPLRGLGRGESLRLVLGDRAAAMSAHELEALADRKNGYYLDLVGRMTPADLLPGAADLLRGLRTVGVATAVASSSRNAPAVIERLGIGPLLDVIVDGNAATRSKPDPQVFLLAAERLRVEPDRCVVVEDAASGVDAALAAGMRVIGVGPARRVGRAHRVVGRIGDLRVDDVLALLSGPRPRDAPAPQAGPQPGGDW